MHLIPRLLATPEQQRVLGLGRRPRQVQALGREGVRPDLAVARRLAVVAAVDALSVVLPRAGAPERHAPAAVP